MAYMSMWKIGEIIIILLKAAALHLAVFKTNETEIPVLEEEYICDIFSLILLRMVLSNSKPYCCLTYMK